MSHTSSANCHIVVSYDIINDRRRNRVLKTLKDYGEHIQYSVFECLLDDKTAARLETRLASLINNDEDSIRMYRLCSSCRERTKVMGTGKVTEDPDVFVV